MEHRIFNGLKRLIAQRKETALFADFDNRHLLPVASNHLLVFYRSDSNNSHNRVLVVGNFGVEAEVMDVGMLRLNGFFQQNGMRDICSGMRITLESEALVIPPLCCYWLTE